MDIPFEQKMKFLDNEESEEHVELKKRLKKTLYYGKIKNMDCPSLAMTELAVEFLQELAPRELGRIDMYWASSASRDVSVTPCALMLALMYIKRLKLNNSHYLSQVSSSDLFLVSVLVASKYLYDEGENDDASNIQWSCLTKMDVEDINENERSFLNAMDWKVFVKPDDFWSFLHEMETRVAWKMSLRRDSFTYTDLSVLCFYTPLCQILCGALTEVFKVVVVCSVAYAACVTTMFLSNVIPIALLRYALLPQSFPVNIVQSVLPNQLPPAEISCPSNAFRISSCIQANSLPPVSSDSDNVCNPCNLPSICAPWDLAWNPKLCVHSSACVTVALMRELVISVFDLCESVFALAVGVACGVRQSLHLGQNFILSDGFVYCHHHRHCQHDHDNRFYNCPSSDRKSSMAFEAQPNQKDRHQDLLGFANKSQFWHERNFCPRSDDYSCWNLSKDVTSPSLNYSMMFSGTHPAFQFVEFYD